jgi:hypothetical protein
MSTPTTITLSGEQRDFVRQLLLDELKDGSRALADHAHEASEAVEDRIPGTDARGVWKSRVRASAELLDTIGWYRQDGN